MKDSLLDPVPSVAAADAATATALHVAELEAKLRRERSRRLGLERGVEALSERVAELQRENAQMRARLGGQAF